MFSKILYISAYGLLYLCSRKSVFLGSRHRATLPIRYCLIIVHTRFLEISVYECKNLEHNSIQLLAHQASLAMSDRRSMRLSKPDE